MADFARRMAELRHIHKQERSEMRRISTIQPRGGRQQQAGYDAYYGVPGKDKDIAGQETQHSSQARQQRDYQEDLIHSHEYAMSHAPSKLNNPLPVECSRNFMRKTMEKIQQKGAADPTRTVYADRRSVDKAECVHNPAAPKVTC